MSKRVGLLGLDCGEFDVEVSFSLKFREAFAQLIDVGSRWYRKIGFKLEERRAAHRSGVGFGFHRVDVGTEPAKYATDVVNDAGMVHARSREFVR